jgi:hypothetical protein
MNISITLSLLLLLTQMLQAMANKPKTKEEIAFQQASHLKWEEAMFDSGSKSWEKQWFLDGKNATLVNQ